MGAEVENGSGLPHFWFEKTGPGGEVFDVVVVRGTFECGSMGGVLTLADYQQPIQYGDEFDGPVQSNPLRAVLAREGDLVLFKPSTDVYLTGTAHPPDGVPTRSWTASSSVGPVCKILRLYGPRWFEKRWRGWRLTDAEPTTAIAFDYRQSFGGSFSAPGEDGGSPEHVYKPDNPAGVGWLPDVTALEKLNKKGTRGDPSRNRQRGASRGASHGRPARTDCPPGTSRRRAGLRADAGDAGDASFTRLPHRAPDRSV